jgi:hypothetical protein
MRIGHLDADLRLQGRRHVDFAQNAEPALGERGLRAHHTFVE